MSGGGGRAAGKDGRNRAVVWTDTTTRNSSGNLVLTRAYVGGAPLWWRVKWRVRLAWRRIFAAPDEEKNR